MKETLPDVLSRLEDAAGRKDYFLLRDIYTRNRTHLPEKEGLYWDAVYMNLFGREFLSTVAANRYLSRYDDGGDEAARMHYLVGINRLRTFRYGAAARAFGKLLRHPSGAMDSEEREEAEGILSVCRTLRGVPPQTIESRGVRSIPARRTSFGHLTVRVECGAGRGNFIVDTGANFSTVGLTAAAEMGLVRASGGVKVGTATGVRLDCGLAHAPELDISGIKVRNAVFIVMEDSELSFPEIGYNIEGIIGLPVLRQLGNLTFRRDGISIGRTRIPSDVGCNFCFEGLMPVAEVTATGERLMFTLDTGANLSEFSFGYYNRHTARLDNEGTEQRGLRGGGGGVIRQKALTLPGETLSVGGRAMSLPSMNVIRNDYEFSRGKDGNLGLDALMSGGGFAISFDRMAVYPYTSTKRPRRR